MILLDTYFRLAQRHVQIRGGQSRHRVVAGHRIHYFDVPGHGSGPPVVLLHGLGGSAASFVPMLFGLRDAWSRIYAPDMPGHGLSPLAHWDAPLAPRGHGQLLHTFLKEVVGRPAALVGNSLGGGLALGIALEKPEDVVGLGLLSPAGAPLSAADIADLRSRFTMRSRRDAVAFLRRLTHRPMPAAFLAASDIRDLLNSPAVRHIVSHMSSPERLDTQRMRALRIPVTLVWGASEKVLPAHGLQFFRQHLPPHTRIEVFERCGHVPMLEQPARTIRVLNRLAADIRATYVRGRDQMSA
jgi:pimeloyl-ACP methyl ester carboxylesterase